MESGRNREVVTMQTKTEMRELKLSDLPVENYWLRGIESWQNLADIGGNNVKALIAMCRRAERYRRGAIKANRYFSKSGLEDNKERLIITRLCIESLQGLLKEMSESDLKKPYLPHLRRNDLFQIGDRVVVLLPYPQKGLYVSKINRKLRGKDWVMATIVAPEMEAQFCKWSLKDPEKSVICLTDIPFYGGVSGGVDPRYQIFERKNYGIIPEKEFEFLRGDSHGFLKIWINNINPNKLPNKPDKGLWERIKSGEVVKTE